MATQSIFRGDSDSWTLNVPLSIWSSGGKFFFAIKPASSAKSYDPTDSSAVLKKSYDDTYITSTTATDKVYTLTLLHSDTVSATPGTYIAEFQWVNAAGLVNPSATAAIVKSFSQFKYKIKADINQRVS